MVELLLQQSVDAVCSKVIMIIRIISSPLHPEELRFWAQLPPMLAFKHVRHVNMLIMLWSQNMIPQLTLSGYYYNKNIFFKIMNMIKSVSMADTQTVQISRIPHVLMIPKVQAQINDLPNIAGQYRENEVQKMVISMTTVFH